jgi:hypothetical protein
VANVFIAAIQQTIRQAYWDIQHGDDPWVAIGNFSHAWFGNYVNQRTKLVTDPIELTSQEALTTQHLYLRQWAAFCAASVEYLCLQAHMSVPEWVNDPTYVLTEEEALYTSPLAQKQRVRERLQSEAPEPFKRRNVFCSARVYANKYETLPPLVQSA